MPASSGGVGRCKLIFSKDNSPVSALDCIPILKLTKERLVAEARQV